MSTIPYDEFLGPMPLSVHTDTYGPPSLAVEPVTDEDRVRAKHWLALTLVEISDGGVAETAFHWAVHSCYPSHHCLVG